MRSAARHKGVRLVATGEQAAPAAIAPVPVPLNCHHLTREQLEGLMAGAAIVDAGQAAAVAPLVPLQMAQQQPPPQQQQQQEAQQGQRAPRRGGLSHQGPFESLSRGAKDLWDKARRLPADKGSPPPPPAAG
jgi:hypothetical protein